MVGGPMHGRTQRVPEPPPSQWKYPRREDVMLIAEPPTICRLPEPHVYTLGWYKSRGFDGFGPVKARPVYLCGDPPAPIELSGTDTDEAIWCARAAEAIWHEYEQARLPECLVPDCEDKARLVFVAAENGRLAGRDWRPGDQIRLCPRHGHDVYATSGIYGVENLPEWLRADAMWDSLDAYDAATSSYGGDDLLHQRGRRMRVRISP